MAESKNITVSAGHTYSFELRWETEPIVRIPIKAITCPNGAARIETTDAHGVLDGWRCAIVNVQQPKAINAVDPNNIKDSEYFAATVISSTVVELNKLNIGDMKPYTMDGFLQFNTPVSLAGISVHLRLYSQKGGTLLASSAATDAPLNILTVTIDTVKNVIKVSFPSTATEQLSGQSGWYCVEGVSSDATPVVTQLAYGDITIEKE